MKPPISSRFGGGFRSRSMDSPSKRATSVSERLTCCAWPGSTPAVFDLGELEGKERPQTKRFADDDIVRIRKDARFVSIRQSAPVA